MVSENPQIISLNKSRMRARYWRPVLDRSGKPIPDEWMETLPLPADPMSQMAYFGKGFKAARPDTKGVKIEKSGELQCPYCDFVPKNALGLRTHLGTHISKTNEETKE